MMDTGSIESRTSERPKLWTFPFLKIMGINSFVTLSNSMVMQALPLYVMDLGASKAVAGTLTAFFTVAALACRPLFGNMVDTRGRKITLLLGCGIFVITSLLYRIAPIVPLIMLIRSIQGFGNSAYSTAAGTIVADILPSSRISEGIGYYGISFNVATAFGPTLMLFLSGNFGYTSVFLSTCVISLIALAFATTINYEKRKKAESALTEEPAVNGSQTENQPKAESEASMKDPVKQKKKFSFDMAVEKTAIPGALVMILTGCPMGLTGTFLVKFGQMLDISGIGLYFTFNAIAMICSRLFVGKLCDKIGAHRALPPGLLLIFCGVLTIATSRSLVQFCIAALFMGFGYGILNPTIQAFTVRSAPLNRRGAASATYYSAIDLGSGVGSMLGGVLAQTIGFALTFGLYAFFIVGASLMFVFVLRKKILQKAMSG